MEQITQVYKAKADTLQATLEKTIEELQSYVAELQRIRSAVADLDERFGLTEGRGGQHELLAMIRRNFPDYENASDEEILNKFGTSSD